MYHHITRSFREKIFCYLVDKTNWNTTVIWGISLTKVRFFFLSRLSGTSKWETKLHNKQQQLTLLLLSICHKNTIISPRVLVQRWFYNLYACCSFLLFKFQCTNNNDAGKFKTKHIVSILVFPEIIYHISSEIELLELSLFLWRIDNNKAFLI